MANMLWERILEALQDKGGTPNKFTLYLGEQLKKAREEAGLSQAELAKKAFRRRPSISDMENGKMMPDIGTVVLLAAILDKSVMYFIPSVYIRDVDHNGELTDLEIELLVDFRKLGRNEQLLELERIRTILEHSE